MIQNGRERREYHHPGYHANPYVHAQKFIYKNSKSTQKYAIAKRTDSSDPR